MKKLFVGNLDFQVREDELRALFAQYGSVDRVDIVRDGSTGQPRGFGFVEMADSTSADKALAELNGAQLGTRKLNVNEARPRPERVRGGERRRSGSRW